MRVNPEGDGQMLDLYLMRVFKKKYKWCGRNQYFLDLTIALRDHQKIEKLHDLKDILVILWKYLSVKYILDSLSVFIIVIPETRILKYIRHLFKER